MSFNPRDHVKLGWTPKIKNRAKAILSYIQDGTRYNWRDIAENYTGTSIPVETSIKKILDDLVSLTAAAFQPGVFLVSVEQYGTRKNQQYKLRGSEKLEDLFAIIDSIPMKERKEYVHRESYVPRGKKVSTEVQTGIEYLKPCGANEILIRDRSTGLYGLSLRDQKVIVQPTKTLIDLFTNYEENRKIGYLENL